MNILIHQQTHTILTSDHYLALMWILHPLCCVQWANVCLTFENRDTHKNQQKPKQMAKNRNLTFKQAVTLNSNFAAKNGKHGLKIYTVSFFMSKPPQKQMKTRNRHFHQANQTSPTTPVGHYQIIKRIKVS